MNSCKPWTNGHPAGPDTAICSHSEDRLTTWSLQAGAAAATVLDTANALKYTSFDLSINQSKLGVLVWMSVCMFAFPSEHAAHHCAHTHLKICIRNNLQFPA